MSTPITSVTENRVTITANDTEENIRTSAGFAESEPLKSGDLAVDGDEPVVKDARQKLADAVEADAERNADGTFKAKATDKAEKPAEEAKAADGDPRKSIQAKINAAVAKQRDAERRAEDAERRANEREAELQALRRPRAVAEPAQPAAKAPTYLEVVQRYQALPDAPKLDDFAAFDDPYGGYQAAMSAFIADQRYAEREQQSAQARVVSERQAKGKAALEIGAQNHPDFQDLLQAHTTWYPDAVMEQLSEEAVKDPSLSAELVHHLLTHPDDAARLASATSPIAAARELGRLTAVLSSASSGPETVPTQTNAKPLIKPVRPSVMAHESSPPDDLPFGPQYIARMNEQERKAREARRV